MLTPIAVAAHDGSGASALSSFGVSVGNIGLDEFILVGLTWETGNPTSVSFSDGVNTFAVGTEVWDAGDGKGLIFGYVLDSVAVSDATITATFVGATPDFIDITVLRYRKHGGTVTFNEEGSSTSGTGTTSAALPTKTWRDINFAMMKMFGSSTTRSNVGPYVARYGGNIPGISTSAHLFECRDNRGGSIAGTAVLSASQNYIAQSIGFTYTGAFPATSNVPAWYVGAGVGNVAQIPGTTITEAGLRDFDLATAQWDTAALFTSYSGGAVGTKSFKYGSAGQVNGAHLLLNGQGHSAGYGNDTLAFGPMQAEVPGWFRLRDTTQPWVDNTSVYANGDVAGAHTYNAIYFDGSSTRNRLLFPGRLFRNSDATSDGTARYFDLAQANPQFNQPWAALSTTGLGFIWSAFDPLTNLIWGGNYPQSTGVVKSYDVATDTATTYNGKSDIGGAEFYCCIDTSRKIILILFRGAGTIRFFDAANPTADYTTPAPAGTAPTAGTASACLYDPVDDRFVVYVGSNTLYYLTNVAGTWTWSNQVFGGATPGAPASTGTYGRFAYVAQGQQRGYLLANSATSPVYMFRPTSATLSGPPVITSQPADQTVNNAATATFTVSATGTGALHYQWKDDGANVGTDSATYAPAATYAMQGAQITVVVTDDGGSTTSNAATLRVAANTVDVGPRVYPMFGGPFASGAFGAVVRAPVAGAGVTGTLASTQAVNTDALAGSVASAGLTGTLAGAQAPNTGAVAAGVAISGAATRTQASNTGATVATATVSGTAAATQALNAGASTGAVGAAGLTGAAAATQALNTAAATGGAVVAGAAAATQASNTTAVVGGVAITGAAATPQALNTTAAAGSVGVSGTAATTQALNTDALAGTVSALPVTGTVADTQAPNVSTLTGAVLVSSAGGSTDPSFANVSLLLHLDGTNGSTTFTDSSSSPKTVTPLGNAQISTSTPVFGSGALALDGTGDYLSVATNAAFGFGTSPFTLEARIKINAVGLEQVVFDTRPGASAFDGVFYVAATTGRLAFYNGGTTIGGTGTAIVANTWTAVAWTWDGGTLRAFIDGVLQWSTAHAGSFGTTRPLMIGSNWAGGAFLAGQIEEIRVTKGVARYTSTYTVAATAFSDASSGSTNFQALNTAAASGAVGNVASGTAAATQALNTDALIGAVLVSGAIAGAQALNTAALSGTVVAAGVSGTAAATQALNTGALVGGVGVTGTAAATQALNTGAAAGAVLVSGTNAAAQALNTDALSGTVLSALTGTAAATQALNVGVMAGAVGALSFGAAASAQALNTDALAGAVLMSGAAATTQNKNTAAKTGSVAVSGTAAGLQALNTASQAGSNPVAGTGAATQAPNAATASGSVLPIVTGTVAATQALNTGAAAGNVLSPATGTAAAAQALNTSALNGNVGGAGTTTGTIADVQALNVGAADNVYRLVAAQQMLGPVPTATISTTAKAASSTTFVIGQFYLIGALSLNGNQTVAPITTFGQLHVVGGTESREVGALQAIPAFGQVASALAPEVAVAAQTLPTFDQAATAAHPGVGAAAAQALPAFGQVSTAKALLALTAGQIILPFGQIAASLTAVKLVGAQTLPPFGQVAVMPGYANFVANQRTIKLTAEQRGYSPAPELRGYSPAPEARTNSVS